MSGDKRDPLCSFLSSPVFGSLGICAWSALFSHGDGVWQSQHRRRSQEETEGGASAVRAGAAMGGREAFLRERELREEAELRYARVRAALDEQVVFWCTFCKQGTCTYCSS